ncbi:hypothetical protein EAE91_20935 [Photorhabdus noenieputensis]|uniref:hypothetical protein n=1 Tax=Photorhabdus noenieputensis TaxID=1208607 RepID=UPI001BD53037|nr:hypothetical protein [Photorhabdus noenieputensis]MBS9439516.1 hypothetical protein [Photorhabdus noenieputensis]MCK3669677.1 hypothetical protein [Photorhabdus noenieputensis]
MTEKEEFLAYIAEMRKIVEQWPDWKKVGLRTPRNPYISGRDNIALKPGDHEAVTKNKLV